MEIAREKRRTSSVGGLVRRTRRETEGWKVALWKLKRGGFMYGREYKYHNKEGGY